MPRPAGGRARWVLRKQMQVSCRVGDRAGAAPAARCSSSRRSKLRQMSSLTRRSRVGAQSAGCWRFEIADVAVQQVYVVNASVCDDDRPQGVAPAATPSAQAVQFACSRMRCSLSAVANISVRFGNVGRLVVQAAFDGGDIVSDGGVMLVREADRRLGLTKAAAAAFTDQRRAASVRHSVPDMLVSACMRCAAAGRT